MLLYLDVYDALHGRYDGARGLQADARVCALCTAIQAINMGITITGNEHQVVRPKLAGVAGSSLHKQVLGQCIYTYMMGG